MKVNYFLTLVAVSMSLGLTACQNSQTDPTTDYQSLNNSVPPQNKKILRQTGAGQLFKITPSAAFTYQVGQSKSVNFTTEVYVEGLVYTVQGENMPKDMSITNTKNVGEYAVSWTPGSQYVTSRTSVQGKFRIRIVASSKSTPEALAIWEKTNYLETATFDWVVNKDTTVPTIEKVVGGDKLVKEDQNVAITVDVKAAVKNANDLDIRIYDNQKSLVSAKAFSGTSAVDVAGPRQLSPGLWQYTINFNSKKAAASAREDAKELKTEISGNIKSQITFSFKNKLNMVSTAEKAVTVEILNTAVPAAATTGAVSKVTAVGEPKASFKAGEENASFITFKADSGKLKIDAETMNRVDFSALPGQPKIECNVAMKQETTQECKIFWKATCDVKDQYAVKIPVINTINGKDAKSSFDYVIKFDKNTNTCKAAPKTASTSK